jgi:CheY-like chemotaxis protein
VRHVVEAHGGTVQAESGGEGLGATFRITLPAAVQPMEVFNLGQTAGWSSGPPGAPAAPPSLAGLKVLVVDDEPDTKEVLKRMLEGCQAQVLTAGSAAEALEIVKRQPPHVLLSDIGMPGEDGYQLIRRVRQVAPELPAVALTAYARSADRHRVLSSGFQAHLAKPVEARQLLTLVAKLAGRKEEPE